MLTHRIRTLVWLLAPLFLGVAVGLSTSKTLWGYFWSVPSVLGPRGKAPLAISVVRHDPSLRSVPPQERNRILSKEFRVCQDVQMWQRGIDCTYGRILAAWPLEQLMALPGVPESEVKDIVSTSGRFFPEDLVSRGLDYGVVLVLESGFVVVSLSTRELSDDTYGHVELLLRGLGASMELVDSAYYYYDVAGIEFATSKFLVVLGVLLAYIIGAFTFVTFRIVAARGRRRQLGRTKCGQAEAPRGDVDKIID